jgi:O-antigen/teichoic acid export membrane protein
MSSRLTISAGVLDAGFSSLATFGIGVFAILYFEPAILGSYALAFTAVNLVAIIPRELVYHPAEIQAVQHSRASRLRLLPRALALGLLPAFGAALLAALWSFAAPAGDPPEIVTAFTVTAVACAFVSPVQDHLRRMLHIGGQSWLAVIVSVVQVLAMAAALALMLHFGVPVAWIHFGAVAIANLASLIAGGLLLYFKVEPEPLEGPVPSFRELLRSGWRLLLGGICAPVSVFTAAALLTHIVSSEALGFAHAARVLARPVPVLAMGLSSVLRPLSIEAGQKRLLPLARRTNMLYLRLLAAFGAVYLLLAGFNVEWNLLAAFLPTAYAVTGLAALTIAAEFTTVSLFSYQHQMMGAGRLASLTRIEAAGAVARILVATSGAIVGPFALPLGHMAHAACRWVGFRSALRKVYAVPPAAEPDTDRAEAEYPAPLPPQPVAVLSGRPATELGS